LAHPFLQATLAIQRFAERSQDRVWQVAVVQFARRLKGLGAGQASWYADDGRPGRNVLDDNRTGSDPGVIAHRNRSQDSRASADNHVIAYGWVALGSFHARATQDSSLVQEHIVPDLCGLANHHAHAAVNERASAEHGPGMDLYAGEPTVDVRDQTAQEE
jgi:hypothetical protein